MMTNISRNTILNYILISLNMSNKDHTYITLTRIIEKKQYLADI